MLASQVAVAFTGWRAVGLDTPVTVFPDSRSYRGGASLDVDLVSALGNAPRAVLVPAFYALFDSDQARAHAQWALSTTAWLLLALAVATSLRSVPARAIGVTAVLAVGGLPQVWSWDFAILSESLSITLAVLALAAGIRYAARPSGRTACLLALALTAWVAARVDVVPAVLVAAAALAALALLRRSRSAAVLTAVALAASSWAVWTTTRLDPSFAAVSASGLSHSEELFAFGLRERVLTDPAALGYFERRGLPACPGVTTADSSTTQTARFLSAFGDCEPLREWAATRGRATLLSYVVDQPSSYLDWLRDDLPELSTGTVYLPQASAEADGPLETALYGGPGPQPERALGGLLLLALFAAGALSRRQPGFAVGATSLVALTGGIGGLLAGHLLSAGEVARLALPETVLLRVASLLVLAAAVDVVWSLLRRERAEWTLRSAGTTRR